MRVNSLMVRRVRSRSPAQPLPTLAGDRLQRPERADRSRGLRLQFEAQLPVPPLLTMVASGRIPAEKMGTHRFTFDRIIEAYDVFADAAANSALKVVITP